MNDPLAPLLDDGVVEEVVARLKSGKEADLWLVRHAGEIVAAKVYKAREARNFKNNAGYREGRQVRDSRMQRAMDRGSRFGQAAAEDAWKTKESDALHQLHAAGVRVPRPVMFYEGVLLMEVVVDADGHPAPRLVDAGVGPEQAAALYADLRAQVVAMLCRDLIHGDLSPYNVLVGHAGPVIIDFPQVVGAAHNSQAEKYFTRDLENIRRFFAGIDPGLDAASGDAREIWRAYVRRELSPGFVPSGRPEPVHHRGGEGRPHGQPGGQGQRGERRGPGDQQRGGRPERRFERGPGEQQRSGRPEQRSERGPGEQQRSGRPEQRLERGPGEQRGSRPERASEGGPGGSGHGGGGQPGGPREQGGQPTAPQRRHEHVPSVRPERSGPGGPGGPGGRAAESKDERRHERRGPMPSGRGEPVEPRTGGDRRGPEQRNDQRGPRRDDRRPDRRGGPDRRPSSGPEVIRVVRPPLPGGPSQPQPSAGHAQRGPVQQPQRGPGQGGHGGPGRGGHGGGHGGHRGPPHGRGGGRDR
ncbi:MAG: RIO1 family regulatory kinase/ATPase [Anaeromyxobacter sp.]